MEESNLRYSSGRNYSWAAFLILVGIMFLLNTTGTIGWGIWLYIARFWPILIVLIGIRLILGNSLVARILGMLFTIVLTIGAFGVAYMQFTEKGFPFLPSKINDWVLEGGSGMFNLGQESVEESIILSSDEYTGVQERSLTIDVGACDFKMRDDDIEEYISIETKFPKSYESPELEHTFDKGKLDLTLTGATAKAFYLFYDESKYDITLGQWEIPTDLDITLGAGKGGIILEKVPVKDFWAEVGAGKFNIEFNVDTIPTGDVRLTVGAGEMNLKIPTRVGYILDYDLGIGSITMNGGEISGVSGGRGKYTSGNYNTSDMKINIYVSVGVGEFNIDNI